MRSPVFRRIARVFAALLLLWTAVDVFDYSVCVHHHGNIGSFDQLAVRASTDKEPASEDSDDCFCCSRLVDVRLPYHIEMQLALAWVIPDEAPVAVHLDTSRLYHPPLA